MVTGNSAAAINLKEEFALVLEEYARRHRKTADLLVAPKSWEWEFKAQSRAQGAKWPEIEVQTCGGAVTFLAYGIEVHFSSRARRVNAYGRG